MSHLAGVLRRFVATRTKWDMYQQGQARRLLWGIVSTPRTSPKNPQLQVREWLTPVEHPGLGRPLRYPGPPYCFSETPWAIRRARRLSVSTSRGISLKSSESAKTNGRQARAGG